jgi:hypothetical protein
MVWDMCYGVGVEEWDKEATSKDELETVLAQFKAIDRSDSCTVVLWCHWRDMGLVEDVLKRSNYGSEIAPVCWYKDNQNVQGPSHRWTYSWEVCLIGRKLGSSKGADRVVMDANPLKRHNLIGGPTMRNYKMQTATDPSKRVNAYEKPPYLMEELCAMYSKANEWVLVVGAGAGGEVFGAINMWANVVAVERDAMQVKYLKGNILVHDAKRQEEERKEKEAQAKGGRERKSKSSSSTSSPQGCGNCGVMRGPDNPDAVCARCKTTCCKSCAKIKGATKFCGPDYEKKHASEEATRTAEPPKEPEKAAEEPSEEVAPVAPDQAGTDVEGEKSRKRKDPPAE